MRQEAVVLCQTYRKALSIKHILIYCRNHAETRTNLNFPKHLHETLGPDQEKYIEKIITFLKLTKL